MPPPPAIAPKPGKETNRVSLVEFFTNAHYKKPGKEEGAIGGALGNEGVMTYFPRSKVAMLTYHLAHPQLELDSLANELAQETAAFYGVEPAVQLVNGTRSFPGQGHRSDAEAIFHEGREVILSSLAGEERLQAGTHRRGRRRHDRRHPHGDATCPPAMQRRPTVQIVLAERGVLYPGKSKIVIQRMVARAALTDSAQGHPVRAEGRPHDHSLLPLAGRDRPGEHRLPEETRSGRSGDGADLRHAGWTPGN